MELEDFIYIYEHSLNKLKLLGVKFIKADENSDNRVYYHFVGLFQCKMPPVFDDVSDFSNKDSILKSLKSLPDDFSFEYRKKFTKKIYKTNDVLKWSFLYVFDFKPFNIVDFIVDKDKELMYFKINGFGQFA